MKKGNFMCIYLSVSKMDSSNKSNELGLYFIIARIPRKFNEPQNTILSDKGSMQFKVCYTKQTTQYLCWKMQVLNMGTIM